METMTEQERIELLKQLVKTENLSGIRTEISDFNDDKKTHAKFYSADGGLWYPLYLTNDVESYTDGIPCFMMLDAMEKAGYRYVICSPGKLSNSSENYFQFIVYSKGGHSMTKGHCTIQEAISRTFVAVFGQEE